MKLEGTLQQDRLCASNETLPVRLLRLLGMALLVVCGLILTSATQFTWQVVDLPSVLRLGAFVSSLAMVASSVAAFWWRKPGLRRTEWAAYLTLALLLGEQLVAGPNGAPIHAVALIFGVLVFAIVVARVTRREPAQATVCKCA